MDVCNKITTYSFENNFPISINEIQFPSRFEWESFDDFKKCFNINFENMKYFDDEGELVSVVNHQDFVAFKELVLNTPFPDERVVVIVYEGVLDLQKYGDLEKVKNLNLENEKSFNKLKSNSSTNNSASWNHENYDSSSSSSSTSQNEESVTMDRSKKKKSTNRYAAKLKKELNYLPGSEVSDGQTILKRWRIKNVGSKKWKENSVRGVLLPSEYSDWVSCSSISVPSCFADQKVDIQVEISIKGQWNASNDESSRDICLTWLLYKDGLVTRHGAKFKDYILAQLALSITIRKKGHHSEFQTNRTDTDLPINHYGSSIERIDQSYSILEVLEDDTNNGRKVPQIPIKTNSTVTKEDSFAMELELPDCPNADDFQISDFFSPGSFSQIQDVKNNSKDVHDPSMLSSSKESNFVGRMQSIEEDLPRKIGDMLHDGANIVKSPRLSSNQEPSIMSENTRDSAISVKTEISFVEISDDGTNLSDNNLDTTVHDCSMPEDGQMRGSGNAGDKTDEPSPGNQERRTDLKTTNEETLPVSLDSNLPFIRTQIEEISFLTNLSEIDVSTNNINISRFRNEMDSSSPKKDYCDSSLDKDGPGNDNQYGWKEDTRCTEQDGSNTNEERIIDAGSNIYKKIKMADSDRTINSELMSSEDRKVEPGNIGFSEHVETARPSCPMTLTYGQANYPITNINQAVTTPYRAGCPYPMNVPNVGSGWAFQAGTMNPNLPPSNIYTYNIRGQYQPGVPHYQIRGIYPPMPTSNPAQQTTYAYHPSNNPNVTYYHPSAPGANLGYRG